MVEPRQSHVERMVKAQKSRNDGTAKPLTLATGRSPACFQDLVPWSLVARELDYPGDAKARLTRRRDERTEAIFAYTKENIPMHIRILAAILMPILLAASQAVAHFAFIIPNADTQSAHVIMAETLDPGDAISVAFLGKVDLRMSDAKGKTQALKPENLDENTLLLHTRGKGARLVFGEADLGVMERGGNPHRLMYYPKTVIGNPFDKTARRKDGAPVELVPVEHPQNHRPQLLFLVEGKPAVEAEVTVVYPDGESDELTTDQQGRTPALKVEGVNGAGGRIAAWARDWIDEKGKVEDKEYQQVRRYATLVFDVSSERDSEEHAKSTSASGEPAGMVSEWLPLPETTASFGATVADGWLYVYGGHVSPTHVYHSQSASGKLWRVDLARPESWEELPGGLAVQGMNLATIDGLVYRVGGMQSVNAEGEPTDNRSVANCDVFDPASMTWREMPPLPAGRSSHDVVAVGTRLFVLGGWNMMPEMPPQWHRSIYVMDVADKNPRWESIPQPFHRRALMAAAVDGKIYVVGGFNERNRPSRRVEVFDTRTNKWYEGPDIPGDAFNGFAPALGIHQRRVFLSVGDGTLYRLASDEGAWDQVAATTPRIVHRLASFGSNLLVLGGASEEDMLRLVEAVHVSGPEVSLAEGHASREAVIVNSPAEGRFADASSERDATSRIGRQGRTADGGGAAAAKSRQRTPAEWGQTRCPIMTGEEINDGSPRVTYAGREIALCCESCVSRWNRNADSYAAVADIPQLVDTERPARELKQTFCPVFRDRIVTADNPSTEYEGRTVYFFNATALRRWKKDPARYADPEVLPQLLADAGENRPVSAGKQVSTKH